MIDSPTAYWRVSLSKTLPRGNASSHFVHLACHSARCRAGPFQPPKPATSRHSERHSGPLAQQTRPRRPPPMRKSFWFRYMRPNQVRLGTPARDSGRVIGRPWLPCSVGNGPRPSGLDREGWVRVRHSHPGWLAHREGPRVLRQCQDSTRLNTFSIKPSAVLALARRCLGRGLPNQRPQV